MASPISQKPRSTKGNTPRQQSSSKSPPPPKLATPQGKKPYFQKQSASPAAVLNLLIDAAETADKIKLSGADLVSFFQLLKQHEKTIDSVLQNGQQGPLVSALCEKLWNLLDRMHAAIGNGTLGAAQLNAGAIVAIAYGLSVIAGRDQRIFDGNAITRLQPKFQLITETLLLAASKNFTAGEIDGNVLCVLNLVTRGLKGTPALLTPSDPIRGTFQTALDAMADRGQSLIAGLTSQNEVLSHQLGKLMVQLHATVKFALVPLPGRNTSHVADDEKDNLESLRQVTLVLLSPSVLAALGGTPPDAVAINNFTVTLALLIRQTIVAVNEEGVDAAITALIGLIGAIPKETLIGWDGRVLGKCAQFLDAANVAATWPESCRATRDHLLQAIGQIPAKVLNKLGNYEASLDTFVAVCAPAPDSTAHDTELGGLVNTARKALDGKEPATARAIVPAPAATAPPAFHPTTMPTLVVKSGALAAVSSGNILTLPGLNPRQPKAPAASLSSSSKENRAPVQNGKASVKPQAAVAATSQPVANAPAKKNKMAASISAAEKLQKEVDTWFDLISSGADKQRKSTALLNKLEACMKSRPDLLDMAHPSQPGSTALTMAVGSGNTAVTKWLIAQPALTVCNPDEILAEIMRRAKDAPDVLKTIEIFLDHIDNISGPRLEQLDRAALAPVSGLSALLEKYNLLMPAPLVILPKRTTASALTTSPVVAQLNAVATAIGESKGLAMTPDRLLRLNAITAKAKQRLDQLSADVLDQRYRDDLIRRLGIQNNDIVHSKLDEAIVAVRTAAGANSVTALQLLLALPPVEAEMLRPLPAGYSLADELLQGTIKYGKKGTEAVLHAFILAHAPEGFKLNY